MNRRARSNASEISDLSSALSSILSCVPTVTAIEADPFKARRYAEYFRKIIDQAKKAQYEKMRRKKVQGEKVQGEKVQGKEDDEDSEIDAFAAELVELREVVAKMKDATVTIDRREDEIVKKCLAMCRHLAADDRSTGTGVRKQGLRVAGHLAILRGKRSNAKALEEALEAYQANLLALENMELARIGGEPTLKLDQCSFSIDPEDVGKF